MLGAQLAPRLGPGLRTLHSGALAPRDKRPAGPAALQLGAWGAAPCALGSLVGPTAPGSQAGKRPRLSPACSGCLSVLPGPLSPAVSGGLGRHVGFPGPL